MNEFLNIFLDQIGVIIMGGFILYYMKTGFSKLNDSITQLEDMMSEIREELAHGKVAT